MQNKSVRNPILFGAFLAVFTFTAGCEELDRAAGNAPAKPAAPTAFSQQFLPLEENKSQPASNQINPPVDPNAQAATTPPPSNEPATLQPGQENDPNLKKAEGGDGVKGQGYGGGIITEPVSQYFRLQNRIPFEIQIPKQMQIWKAINNRFPKDFDEFKKEILDPCGITELPELPPNCRYVYDPKTGELLVETSTQPQQ